MTVVRVSCGPRCPGVRGEWDVSICPCGAWVCGSHSDQHAGECPDWVFLLDQNERNQP